MQEFVLSQMSLPLLPIDWNSSYTGKTTLTGQFSSSNKLILPLSCSRRKPPYGSTLVSMATTFPKFRIDLSIEHEQVRDEGVEVEIKVGLDLEKTQPAPITKKGIMNLYASLLILTSDNHFIE